MSLSKMTTTKATVLQRYPGGARYSMSVYLHRSISLVLALQVPATTKPDQNDISNTEDGTVQRKKLMNRMVIHSMYSSLFVHRLLNAPLAHSACKDRLGGKCHYHRRWG